MLNLIINTLKGWRSDWYLLNSGGSFHLIVDEIVDVQTLPIYLGSLIIDMADNLDPRKRTLYGYIGKSLIERSNDKRMLELWVADILENFGHGDEPVSRGKYVFPIDMRWVAHVIEAVAHGNFNEGYLRVSSKHGSVPLLVAQQIDEQVIIFNCNNSPFDIQPGLPGF